MLARSWRLSLYGLDLPVDRVSADYVGSNFCHGFWILFFGNFLPLRSLILVGGGRGAGFRCRQHNRSILIMSTQSLSIVFVEALSP